MEFFAFILVESISFILGSPIEELARCSGMQPERKIMGVDHELISHAIRDYGKLYHLQLVRPNSILNLEIMYLFELLYFIQVFPISSHFLDALNVFVNHGHELTQVVIQEELELM